MVDPTSGLFDLGAELGEVDPASDAPLSPSLTSESSEINDGAQSLWNDVQALLETLDSKGKQLQQDVRGRLDKLRKEGQRGWRRRVTGSADKRIRDHARERVDQLRAPIVRRARKIVTGSYDKRISDHMKTNPVVKMIDRISFTLGVSHFAITEFIVLKRPDLYWIWFVGSMAVLMTLRIYSYVQKRWQFFMFDFCYFAVATCMVSALFFPRNQVFWQINFMFSNGPMMVAVLAWRNSLVFHSLDKMTSIFLHFLPALLTFIVRWYPSRFSICAGEDSSPGMVVPQCSMLTFREALVNPIMGYLTWQLLQIFVTEVVFGGYLARDLTLKTSIRWLCMDHRNGMHKLCKSVCRATGIFAPDETYAPETLKSKSIFWVAQLVYTIVCFIPGILVYHSYTLHVALLLIVALGTIWNGASFYINVFAVRYRLKFGDISDADAAAMDPDSESGFESAEKQEDAEAKSKDKHH